MVISVFDRGLWARPRPERATIPVAIIRAIIPAAWQGCIWWRVAEKRTGPVAPGYRIRRVPAVRAEGVIAELEILVIAARENVVQAEEVI